MEDIRPTLSKPVTPQAKRVDTNFAPVMNQVQQMKSNPMLDEVDGLLDEAEQSLKKKIFDLDKMKTLVFSDPKLTAVYDEMAINGAEKYGYHYNETINNLIFNDYVLNSPKYLQKYKMAIPAKEGRRDKSGINKLKHDGAVKMGKTGTNVVEPNLNQPSVDETTGASSSGAFSQPIGYQDKSIEESTTASSAGGAAGYVGYAGPAAWGSGDLMKKGGKSDVMRRPMYPGGSIIKGIDESVNYLVDPSGFSKFIDMLNEDFDGSANAVGLPAPPQKAPPAQQSNTAPYRNPAVNNKIIDKTAAFSSNTVKQWNKPDTELELHTVNHGTMEEEVQDGESPVVEYVSDRNGEDPFTLGNIKWQFVNAKYPDGKIDIGVYRFGHDMVYDYSWWRENFVDNRGAMDEKAVSKAQQKFFGMVRGVQKGDISPDKVGGDVEKAAETMKTSDVKDFASTKTGKLPEKVKKIEEDMNDENTYEFNIPEWAMSTLINGDSSGIEDEDEAKINKFVQRVAAKFGNANFMLGDIEGEDNLGFRPSNDIDNLGSNVYRLYISASPNNNNNIKEDMQTMIAQKEDSMSNKPVPADGQYSGVEMGMAVNEANSILAKAENDLNAFASHHNKLKSLTEDKRTPSLVNVDRLGSENQTNFKKDLQHSGTKETIDVEKELQWKDQQTEVGKDAQKLSNDIEKDEMKLTDGEALKNVGDSANLKGDEIPKRNFTDEEQEQVDLYRLGLGDAVFDNDPGKKFEERMKADMGDKNYKARQDKLAFRATAPMYNKDTQPTEKGDEKKQYDKFAVNETMVTGRYYDYQGTSHMIDFKLGEAILSESVNETWSSINLSGMGNSYANKLEAGSSKLNVNEGVVNTIDSNKYYVDENKTIHAVKNKATLLTENVNTKPIVNEGIEKMKHLLGYDASKFTNTENSKHNRGF